MELHHNHHHHHDHTAIAGQNGTSGKVFIFSIILNLLFVIVEAIIGFHSNSVGLLSDAGHNLGDVFSLLLALVAFLMSGTHGSGRFTYGYRKLSVLISLLNAVILLVAVIVIIVESITKFTQPTETDGSIISWTAGIGIIINGATALLLMHGRGHDINTNGAFLHMIADTLVSVGVLVSGFVISATGWFFIDAVIGLIIAGVILISSWSLLTESFSMTIDAAPKEFDIEEIQAVMSGVAGVRNVHHIHIWPISTTETALTAHLLVSDITESERILHEEKELLSAKGITHSTLELESHDCGFQRC